ncbi:MAG TPA: ester cyclase [Candidatus Kapabacteria bacterium]|nr:ester cyclase [Candidatus Kapabacteria bacterium]
MRYLFTVCIAATAALMFVSCNKMGSGNDAAMMRMDSIKKSNIDGYMKVTEMFQSGKTDGIEKYVADNIVDHQAMPGQKQGLAGLKEMITNMKAAYPDMKFTVNHITADSNMIWAQTTMSGTNSGPWMGMPPTNKKINVEGVDIIKLGPDGKATDHWGYMEEMKMMTQLGLMPPMGGAPPAADAKQ